MAGLILVFSIAFNTGYQLQQTERISFLRHSHDRVLISGFWFVLAPGVLSDDYQSTLCSLLVKLARKVKVYLSHKLQKTHPPEYSLMWIPQA